MDNLSRNAMLARQAGMSYGQWKALQPIVKVEKTPDERECVCQFCGKTFLLKTRRKRKYCDVYCQNKASKERARERRENEKGKAKK